MGRSDKSSTPILQYPTTPILDTPPLHRALGKHTGRKLQAGRRPDLCGAKAVSIEVDPSGCGFALNGNESIRRLQTHYSI